jgi:hypothetical protein
MSLSVYDIRDLDLMLKLAESPATAVALSEEMGLDGDGSRHVGSRFAWMRRFGMLVLDEKSREWRLSEGGGRVVHAQIKAAAKQRIERIPDEEMIEVMAHVTSRVRLGDPMTAAMLRREFQFGTSPRRT